VCPNLNFSASALPEPHAADYDWRFSDETVAQISDLLKHNKDSIACVGTPSVFRLLAQERRNTSLIDRNPWCLRDVTAKGVFVLDILRDPPPHARAFDVIFMDPPWYPDHIVWWMAWASRILANNGMIISTLFPASTRPTALVERGNLFRFWRAHGSTHILKTNVRYKSPLFEEETDRICGIRRDPLWRSGQLVSFRPNSQLAFPPRPQECAWTRFLFGSQVIMLRDREDLNPAAPSLVPIYRNGCTVLRSVSRRHKARRRVDLWTSRNRVFSIEGSVKRAKAFLSDLIHSGSRAPLSSEEGQFLDQATLLHLVPELERAR
jgi:Probable N6-adenine methyltransferase